MADREEQGPGGGEGREGEHHCDEQNEDQYQGQQGREPNGGGRTGAQHAPGAGRPVSGCPVPFPVCPGLQVSCHTGVNDAGAAAATERP
ncbi:hypothetical protein GCM10010278_81320 [Streptomyces melanogenes]|nr:hypothetical protein GCM10010278_81320 [Streptomyces melanogenes]